MTKTFNILSKKETAVFLGKITPTIAIDFSKKGTSLYKATKIVKEAPKHALNILEKLTDYLLRDLERMEIFVVNTREEASIPLTMMNYAEQYDVGTSHTETKNINVLDYQALKVGDGHIEILDFFSVAANKKIESTEVFVNNYGEALYGNLNYIVFEETKDFFKSGKTKKTKVIRFVLVEENIK